MKKLMMGITIIVGLLSMGCVDNPSAVENTYTRIVVGVGHPYFQDYKYTEVEKYDWAKWKREFDCNQDNNRFVDVKYVEIPKAEMFFEWKTYEWTHIDLCN